MGKKNEGVRKKKKGKRFLFRTLGNWQNVKNSFILSLSLFLSLSFLNVIQRTRCVSVCFVVVKCVPPTLSSMMSPCGMAAKMKNYFFSLDDTTKKSGGAATRKVVGVVGVQCFCSAHTRIRLVSRISTKMLTI